MPIKFDYTPYGTVMKLAALAGKADRAKRQEQINLQKEQIAAQSKRQQVDLQFRKEMADFDSQLDLESAKRARMWEMEKMELRSRLDFQEEEQTRVRKKQEKEAKLEKLDEEYSNGNITQEEYQLIRAKVEYGVTLPSQLYKRDPMKELMAQMMGEGGTEAPVEEEQGWSDKLKNWSYNLGGTPAEEKVGQPKAPEIIGGVMDLPKKINTKEERDALPRGTRYIGPDGVTRIKK